MAEGGFTMYENDMSMADMRYAMAFFEVYLRDHGDANIEILILALCEHRPDLFQLPRDDKVLYKIACKVASI